MNRNLRRRFWLEAGLGLLSTVLWVVTLVHRDWIETVFHTDPDQGGGSLEWLIVTIAVALTLVAAAAAWREWRPAPSSA